MSTMPDGREPTRVGILGTCTLTPAGASEPVELSQIQRIVLSRLALAHPLAVDHHALTQAIWGDRPPTTARAALQNQVSRIRRLADGVIVTSDAGYALRADLDADALRDLTARAERSLAAGATEQAFDLADTAVPSWTGEPYADLPHLAEAETARRALAATHYAAETLRLAAGLELRRVAWAVQEAERLSGSAPHDEHRAGLLARALQLSGRRGEALAAVSATRRTLRRDLGIEPGPALLEIERDILEPDAASPPRHDPPYVGRAAELDRLVDAMMRGQLLRVDGEPGIGISRFLAEARRMLVRRGHAVALVRCPEHPDTAVSVLAEVLDEIGATTDAAGVLTGFVAGVETAAAVRPVVILVDDEQFAGPTTRTALLAVAALPGVSIALAGHRHDAPETARPTLMLEGLPRAELRRFIRSLVDPSDALDDTALADLADASGGNPLFAETLVAGRADDVSPLPAGSRTSPTRTLARIAPLVRRWYAQMPEASRAVLELLAVAGAPTAQDFLESVLQSPAVVPAELVARDGDGALRFRHRIVRDVIYQDLAAGRRDELHHAIGMASGRRGLAPATTAEHLLASARLDADAAYAAAHDAAQAASVLGAHHDAVHWLRRALTVAPDADRGHDALRTRIALGDALRLSGDPGHVEHLLLCADDAAKEGDTALLAEAMFALLQLGGSSDFGGLEPRIIKLTEHALAQITDPELAAPVSAAASLAWSMTGQAERSRRLFLDAERHAVTPATRRQVLPFAYLGLGLPSDLERRTELAAELIDLAHAADDPVALFEGLHLDFSVRLVRADGAGARDVLAAMTSIVDSVGDVGRRWSLRYLAAAIAHLDGDDARCESLALQAFQLFEPVSPSRAVAVYQSQLLPLRLTQGRVGELAEHLGGLVTALPGVPAWHAAYALALSAGGGDATEVTTHLRLALDKAQEDFTWLATHVIGARAAAGAGDEAVAAEFRRRLAPWTGLACWQGTCSYGPVDTALALLARSLGDAAATTTHIATARAVCASLGSVPFAQELVTAGFVPS